ncbi:MAG: hypothetical protein KAI66_14705 [Lentisphaeria bacterium]|nr:hypothetical protein [Lentisphaeria bacterium]
MKTRKYLSLVTCLVWVLALWSSAAEPGRKQGWEEPYTGEEVTGEHVVAFWRFDGPKPLEDVSGKALKLRGESRIVKEGRFGGGLKCTASPPEKPDGARVVQRVPALTPQGAFSVEMWFNPAEDFAKHKMHFLIDSKFYHYAKDIPQANAGFMFMLNASGDKWAPTVRLWFGKGSEAYQAEKVELDPGRWYHTLFTYDGAGTVRIYLDGKDIGGGTRSGRGSVEPAKYDLAIGARIGSSYYGCAATIDEIRITRGLVMGGLSINVGMDNGRRTFYRMEKDVRVAVVVRNNTDKPLANVTADIRFGTSKKVRVRSLAPKQTHTVEIDVDTTLRPGTYEVAVTAQAQGDGRQYAAAQTVVLAIMPRKLPHVMPVVMWGHGDFPQLKEMGFTHDLRVLTDTRFLLETGKPVPVDQYAKLQNRREDLDKHMAEGLGVVAYVAPGRALMKMDEFKRIGRDGKPRTKADVCGQLPRAEKFCYLAGQSVAQAFGDYPALDAALIHTEVRGHTNVCFHKEDHEAYKRYAGVDIPLTVEWKKYKHYTAIPGFPADRIIPDDDPILKYYRWFWKEGDGWNNLHTQVHKGLKSTGRDDLWTFYDPAVRVPCIWGSGGEVDYLSQWTYSYPDPIKVGQATDELFAMAAGRPGQQVMKMTQIIWYRQLTAPKPQLPKDEKKRVGWERDIPDAAFVTISPDHLEIALWSELARPVKGIMYHGWGSLVDMGAAHHYRYTNPITRKRLAALTRAVVRPLGPMLLQVPDPPVSEVAILGSGTSQIFATSGTRGWSNTWEADMHLILQWAQLQPRILFEEAVERDGLDGVRVLVMPGCVVLTRSVARKIVEFQRAGGIVVADERLAPALIPDILVPSHTRTKNAREDKAALQTLAAALREELDTVYTRHVESDNPDVVVRRRQFGEAEYLFAINDKRTYGTYVGQYGLVMEKGLPNAATLTVRRRQGAVYDLLAHRPVEVTRSESDMRFKVQFDPGEGRVYLITPKEIANVVVDAPDHARRGSSMNVAVRVVDGGGLPLAAVVPVRIEVLDARGQPAERSGYYGAKNGSVSLMLDLAANDEPGTWILRATDLASGKKSEHTFHVQ